MTRKTAALALVAALVAALALGGCQPARAQGVIAASNPPLLGQAVQSFAGLQFALDQSSIGTPTGTMVNYATNDSVVLQCPGVTFTTSPSVTVTGGTGAAPTVTLSNQGQTSGAPASGAVACSQASTTGTGTGLNITATLYTIGQRPALLTTGGGNNGSLYMNAGVGDTFTGGGAEDVYLGYHAGFGLTGGSNFNVAVGHNACGSGGTAGAGSSIVCVGTDSARNIQNNSSNGTFLGAGAGRNNAAANNTFAGFQAGGSGGTNSAGALSGGSNAAFGATAFAALTTGGYNAGLGFNVGNALTNGYGNLLLGAQAGSALVNGGYNIFLVAQAGSDHCANGDESNVFALCGGNAGRSLVITGLGTPTSSIAKFSGVLSTNGYTVSGLSVVTAAVGMITYVTDATACTFNSTFTGGGSTKCPAFYNGTAWVAG